MKPRILFVHTACPSQFSDLCEHLNDSGAADAYYMTTPGNVVRNQSRYRNLLPLTPDGNIMGTFAYYYSGSVERASRISRGLYQQLQQELKKARFDLVVAHGSLGSPHFIFDAFGIPVISYIEFPCYADHGWDGRYPPTEGQRLIDKNMQMLNYYNAIKSNRTLVPTEYARGMFPECLRPKVVAQFEGMDPRKVAERKPSGIKLPTGKKTVGFAARDLSSAKGLETFIATAAYLSEKETDLHFVVIGDPTESTYSYEQLFLDRQFGKNSGVNFIDYLMRKYGLDSGRVTRTGKLPYNQFSDLLHHVDLFLYPLKHGSGNWGLMELLIRGRPVIAANRCYVPEFIADGVNGILVSDDQAQVWAEAAVTLLRDDERRSMLGDNARHAAKKYYLAETAKCHMALFEEVLAEFRATGKNCDSELIEPIAPISRFASIEPSEPIKPIEPIEPTKPIEFADRQSAPAMASSGLASMGLLLGALPGRTSRHAKR